jgi:hypothetical protein
MPSLGLVRIGEQSLHTVDNGVHLLKLLFLRQLASDAERTGWPEGLRLRTEKARRTSFDTTRSIAAMRLSMYESFGPTRRERGCSPSGTSASILLHKNNQGFMSEPHLALRFVIYL